MLRVTWCYIHLQLPVSSFICPILSTSHGRLIDRAGHMRRTHAGNMCDPHTVPEKYYIAPEVLQYYRNTNVWPQFSYRNTIVLEKYVWPRCNYSEGFNYEEPSSGVDPLLSHGFHLNQKHFWDQFIAWLFTFCLSKAIKSKMCCLELFSFFWNLCGQCSCFQANTPWGASLPLPPTALLSLFTFCQYFQICSKTLNVGTAWSPTGYCTFPLQFLFDSDVWTLRSKVPESE